MNTLIASTYDALRGIALPCRRILGGRKVDELTQEGMMLVSPVDNEGFQQCVLPSGWRPVASEESPMQLRIVDSGNRLRAKVYYKPASQGGGASMEIFTVGYRLFAQRCGIGNNGGQAIAA